MYGMDGFSKLFKLRESVTLAILTYTSVDSD
nr:MAG TPA: hypothetical protein [Caudoviricetes sp.]